MGVSVYEDDHFLVRESLGGLLERLNHGEVLPFGVGYGERHVEDSGDEPDVEKISI